MKQNFEMNSEEWLSDMTKMLVVHFDFGSIRVGREDSACHHCVQNSYLCSGFELRLSYINQYEAQKRRNEIMEWPDTRQRSKIQYTFHFPPPLSDFKLRGTI